MKIVNATYRINTIDMNDLLTNKNEIANGIGEYITNIQLANVPATAPANIPRIIGKTKDGIMNVIMSNQCVEFAVLNCASANDGVIFSSVMEHVDKIGSFFENYSEAPFNFCGFSLQIKVAHDEIDSNPTDFINGKIDGFDADLAVDNVMIRKCFIQGNYFINMTIRNEKQIKVTAPKQNAKPTAFEIHDEFVIVELDVNDKFGFLQVKDYTCEIEQSLILIEDINKFYDEKLLSFVKTGSFDFFK